MTDIAHTRFLDDPGRAARSREAFMAAHRHSRLVRRLRWMLPVGVGALALLFGLAALVTSLIGGVSIGSISLQGNQLVMERPKLTGFDSARRPYEVMADVARQDVTAGRRFQLERVDANMSFGANGRARVVADEGLYDGEAETFHARGNIRVTTNIGYEVRMQEARVDLRGAALISDMPVEVRHVDDTIVSDRLEVRDNGAVIVFDGNVRVHWTIEDDGR